MTAVLVLAFNRPDHAEVLGSRLRELEDVEVFVSIDGPREGNSSDARAVLAVREALRDLLGKRIIAERQSGANLGCADGVTAGLLWFFGSVPEGIVLEDDCIPTPEFLEFCRLALPSLREDPSAGVISGVNYAPADVLGVHASARSRFPLMWGWASWRRAVSGFSVRRPDWYKEVRRSSEWKSLNPIERHDWRRMFSVAGQSQPHTWDYQFAMHQWVNGRDAVLPAIPLVENIGFSGGTHYVGGPPHFYFMSTEQQRREFTTRLGEERPFNPKRSAALDKWISQNIFSPPLGFRIQRRISRLADS